MHNADAGKRGMKSPPPETSKISRPRRRVVVTGIGLVTPFGCGREVAWSAIREGRRAVRWLQAEELTALTPAGESRPMRPPASQMFWAGAPVTLGRAADHDKSRVAPQAETAALSAKLHDVASEPVIGMALLAADEATRDARLGPLANDVSRLPFAVRCGCVIGTSKVGLRSFAGAMQTHANGTRPSDMDWDLLWPDAAASVVARCFGLRGPSLCPVAACATGLVSLIRGADLIRSDECDVVLAGSSDASLVPIVLGSFQRLGVLARRFDDPS